MSESTQTNFTAELSGAMQTALANYRDLLDRVPGDHPGIANLKDGLTCCELAFKYYEEASRAIQAEVWFAAAAVAAAALEAMLLGRMFTDSDNVLKLASFKKLLDNHKGNLGSFARKEMDLGRLIEMAKILGWFRPGGIPPFLIEMMASHVGRETLLTLAEVFKDSSNAGLTSANLLRQYRNLLHPASCLRQEIQPTKDVGIRATFFCLVAYASLGPN